MSFLSLFHSISAIGVASYVSYNNSPAVNQLFYSSVDVVAVTAINMVMAGANAHKEGYTIKKKIIDDNEIMAEADGSRDFDIEKSSYAIRFGEPSD
jgi:hypothetical protein